jgi:hypothetical protein
MEWRVELDWIAVGNQNRADTRRARAMIEKTWENQGRWVWCRLFTLHWG